MIQERKQKMLDVCGSEEVKQKRVATNIERFGTPNVMQNAQHKKVMSEKIRSKEVQEKTKQTCMERYGVESVCQLPEVKEKMRKGLLDKTGYEHALQNPETLQKKKNTMKERFGVEVPLQNEQIKQKRIDTLQKRYGVTSPLQIEDVKYRRHQTMKKNGSFKKSQPEEEYFQYLVSKYGADDVKRHYKEDERYPFECDFYIKSEDMFIELNIHLAHGEHPFDETSIEDQKKLNELKQQTTVWSKSCVECWSISDVNKRQIALLNNLNYCMLYRNDFYKGTWRDE